MSPFTVTWTLWREEELTLNLEEGLTLIVALTTWSSWREEEG